MSPLSERELDELGGVPYQDPRDAYHKPWCPSREFPARACECARRVRERRGQWTTTGAPDFLPENFWRECWHRTCPESPSGPYRRTHETRDVDEHLTLRAFVCCACGVRVWAGLHQKTRRIVTELYADVRGPDRRTREGALEGEPSTEGSQDADPQYSVGGTPEGSAGDDALVGDGLHFITRGAGAVVHAVEAGGRHSICGLLAVESGGGWVGSRPTDGPATCVRCCDKLDALEQGFRACLAILHGPRAITDSDRSAIVGTLRALRAALSRPRGDSEPVEPYVYPSDGGAHDAFCEVHGGADCDCGWNAHATPPASDTEASEPGDATPTSESPADPERSA